MAGFFVIPQNDETLRSILARYCTIMNYENGNAVGIKFFGRRNLPSKMDLPSNLNFLIKQIDSITDLTKEEIIEGHTLWPFYRAFISNVRRIKIYDRMSSGNGAIYSTAGVNASKMKKNKLDYYCPLCYKEDRIEIGFAIWRLSHQIPEIQVCTKHKCYLIARPSSHKSISRTAYVDLDLLEGLDLTVRFCSCEKTISISNRMVSILDGSFKFGIESINYGQLLQNSIYSRGKYLKVKQLSSDIKEHYSSSSLFCDIITRTDWVPQILKRPKHYFHPLRHILMYQYLVEVKTIQKIEINPFGLGPWRCINPVCVHYNTFSIATTTSHVDKKANRVIFTFECVCGLIYSKSLSIAADYILNKPRIKVWGSVWENALQDLLKQKLSLREIGRRLGTDAKTVVAHSKVTIDKSSCCLGKESDLIIEHRKFWLDEMARYSSNQVRQARSNMPATYAYLYRHDRSWLLTANKMLSSKRVEAQLRLDWEVIDTDLCDQIFRIVAKLKSENYKGRITKNVILSALNKHIYLINKNKNKLPTSFLTVNSKSESKLDYAKRRIDMSIQQLRLEFLEFPKWKVMRKAGITKKSGSIALKYLDTQFEKLAS